VSPPVYPPGTTAVVGELSDPACLNVYLSCGSLQVTTRITGPVLAGAYRVTPDLAYEPVLVDDVKITTKPFTLTYSIEPEAAWSDGVPVSADDFLFTLDSILDPANDVFSRAGYDRISDAVKVDAKTVRFVFGEPYAAWKGLFPQVLPKHVLAGTDFDMALRNSIPVASGPFKFESWQQGTQLTLLRNNGWWGAHDAYLQRLVFRFIPNTSDRLQALLSGELTVVQPSQSEAALYQGAPGIVTERSPGATFDHFDFNVGSTSLPLLREAWFREAVVYALDRDAAVAVGPAATAPGLEVLDSLVYLDQQKEQKSHFDRYAYAPGQVAKIMTRHGCVTGSDGIWSCGGTRASLGFATTSTSALRLQMQETLRVQAATAGIELVPDNSPPTVLFGTRLPTGDFDLIWFAWTRTGDPYGLKSTYGCGGSSNFSRYCSPAVTGLLEASDVELSEGARASLVNKADAGLADDLPSIPLYLYPSFLAYWPALDGIVDNAGPPGFTWNIEDWRFN